MMSGAVLVKSYEEPEFNISEILRYARCKDADPEILKAVGECTDEARRSLSYRVCYAEFPLTVSENTVKLPFAEYESASLSESLSGCESAVLFAATVGIGIDRLIAKYGSVSPFKALLFQALGAERIESLCDAFCADIKELKRKENRFLSRRFSPGYADFKLEAQTDFFKVLDCSRKIGLSLNKSLLMSPSKSVTAIIGISDMNKACGERCGYCENIECEYRS